MLQSKKQNVNNLLTLFDKRITLCYIKIKGVKIMYIITIMKTTPQEVSVKKETAATLSGAQSYVSQVAEGVSVKISYKKDE